MSWPLAMHHQEVDIWGEAAELEGKMFDLPVIHLWSWALRSDLKNAVNTSTQNEFPPYGGFGLKASSYFPYPHVVSSIHRVHFATRTQFIHGLTAAPVPCSDACYMDWRYVTFISASWTLFIWSRQGRPLHLFILFSQRQQRCASSQSCYCPELPSCSVVQ